MYRLEKDSIGTKQVPADAYYGVQSLRGMENFQITGQRLRPEFIESLAEIKKACAICNYNVGELDGKIKDAIVTVCDEILAGKLHDQFICDPIQGGAGTTANMNANEVIANRGNALADKKLLHPNDDVNMSQSSNDTFPTAMHLAAVLSLEGDLLPAVEDLIATLRRLETENEGIVKSG